MDSQVGTKQDSINDGDLTIANTSGLQSALDDKQDTIEDGDLTIAKTSGLQTALNNKQDTIEDGDLTIAFTSGLQTALNNKQDTIEDGDLTIAFTSGLQTALNNKQDEIGEFTRLTLNGVTSGFITTGTISCDNITTTFDGSIGRNLNVVGVITAPNQPCFKLKCNNTATSSAGTNLNYNGVVIDNYSAYDINAREYVIPVAGN